MINKISTEIDDFTNNIKEVKGCDEMLSYVNSGLFSSIKLLMFASKAFLLCAKLQLFVIIALLGFLISSSIGAIHISSTLLLGTVVFLFALLMIFISHFKKLLIASIENSKAQIKQSES